MSLLSLPRAGSRSRRLIVCGTAAAVVLLPGVAQAETAAPAPATESSAVPTSESSDGATAAAVTPTATPTDATSTTSAAPTDPTPSASASTTTESTTTSTGATASTDALPTTPSTTDEPVVPLPEFDPALLTRLFTPVCDLGTLTGLTLQLGQLQALSDELTAMGVPVPADAFPLTATGTVDIPLDDATLGAFTAELNASSAEFAELGLDDPELTAALAELPAPLQADVTAVLDGLKTGTLQPQAVRTLLQDLIPCPAAPAPVAEDVTYLGYAPTGGDDSTGGSPLALLGAGAALLAGGGLFTASALRSRAARA